jgi:probable rRNA maturation factor
VTILESNIFITGNLEGLDFSRKNISLWIHSLVTVEESINELISGKELNLSFVSRAEIQDLNRRFLNKDKPTNVLSFPSSVEDSSKNLLGDIAICPDIIKSESLEQGKPELDHLIHLIIHSVLHLVGYDHQDKKSEMDMEAIEIKVLKKLGIANPY